MRDGWRTRARAGQRHLDLTTKPPSPPERRAAFNGWMCDEGASQQQLLERFEGSLVGPAIRPVPFTGPDGSDGADLYLDPEAFRDGFAADVDPETAAVMAAAQRPYGAAAFAARVVAVQFWTYTCINWLRTLPYVRAWAAKYQDQGLTVIGAHTPEFGFERNVDNVTAAARDMRVHYPVAVDSDYAVWRAFANQFWPALYIADEQGRIRYHHFGEGEYAMSEMVVQQLLREAGKEAFDPALVSVDPKGTEVAADWSNVRTPETYLGFAQAYGFASPDGERFDEPHNYPEPPRLSLNQWAPSGRWTLAEHAAVLNETPGRLAIGFHARDVNLVMGPAARSPSVPFRVLIDGQTPGAAHGIDVDEHGNGTLSEQRMYQLIRQPMPIADRQFEIEFLGSGVEAYSFTFG